MLKRFSIENFASFKGEQSFDLTAGRTEVLPEHVVDFADVKLLKSAVIYGANASGKSNLVKALDYAKKIIVNGLSHVDTHKKYFRLDEHSSKQQSSFDFELEIDNRFFSYGFSAVLKDKVITEEWLYEIGKNKPELVFQRNKETLEFGKLLKKPSIKARFEIYQDDMKNQRSQLFLAEIAGKDLELVDIQVMNSIYHWFDEKLLVIYPDDIFNGMSSINEDHTNMFTKYLRGFDTGVVKINAIDEDFDIRFKHMTEEVRATIEKDLSKRNKKEFVIKVPGDNPQFLTVYKDDDGELKVRKLGLVHGKNTTDVFELKDESDGTRRLLDFIPLISKFAEDYTVVIDEFDRSLHPKLTRAFFELFYQSHQSKAQLIVTTHESTLLDLELLRRDEIWFVEKGEDDSSSLFSLNKFKIRYDSKIEKAYLLGRYGAVPVFGSFDNIDWDSQDGI
ncbi:MAG: AAA15 family ATPase/GTPase [Phenylobacterium sp.]|jgi:AAA15 family ATPase/GTPase